MSWIKQIIFNLPGVKNLKKKFDTQEKRMNELQNEIKIVAQENIELRLKYKKINHERICVVFVCHRPSIWESLHSVYDALKTDERFKVILVAIPSKDKKPGVLMEHEEYTCEGAEEFWKEDGCINGYDYNKKEWVNIRTLKPDYVFFQQPYNIIRCQQYKSWIVSLYARLLYVPYGTQIIGGGTVESTNPKDFLKDVYCYFSPEQFAYEEMKEWLDDDFTNIELTGFPRFDQYQTKPIKDANIWKFKDKQRKFRIIWTTRWCTGEGNCTFFDYCNNVLEYAKENKDVEIVFRPHPQAFREWAATGEMPKKEQEKFRNKCEEAGITIDEEGEYISKLMTADCFITDPSSLMGEFFITGKPIIYTYKKDCLTRFGNILAEGYYVCDTWERVKSSLEKLKNGEDTLIAIRKRIIKEYFCIPQEGVGVRIKEYILKDAGY